jgi:hypothetical protein
MSRQLMSRANQVFYGRAALGNYQMGQPGGEVHFLYRFRPVGNRAVTFTANPAAGATSAPLNANWAGASGIFPITFPDGEVLNGIFTNGATTCPFLPGSFPQVTSATLGPYGGTGALVNAQSAATAVVGNQPPVLGVANFYSVSASIAAAGLAVLAATTPDVPRNVVGAWTTSSTVTVAGLDFYGYAQTETQTGTAFTGKKAFSQINSITSSAAVTAATFGTGNVLGLPFHTQSGDFLSPMFNDAADASTFVAGDNTFPATAATGDVRGTVTVAGTLNGAKFYSCLIKPIDPATQWGLFGVPPV